MSKETEAKPSNPVESMGWLAFIKTLPESEDYVFQDEEGYWVTQEWLCGTFAGRGFVDENYEAACAQMIDYLNRHIGHNSMVGNTATDSGWPNQEMVKEYLNAND